MALYKGSNQIGKLHKGDELVTRVFKGDELIYRDIEALYGFKFTVNTTLDNNIANTRTIRVPTSFRDVGGQTASRNSLIFKWGDGTETVWNGQQSYVVTHQYATHGTYQITVIPNKFEGAEPIKGWLSCLNFAESTWAGAPRTVLVSFDTPYPKNSLVRYKYTTNPGNKDFLYNGQMFGFELTKIQSYPEDLLDNVEYIDDDPTSFNNFANGAFKNFPLDPFPLFRTVMSKLDFSQAKDCTKMFYETFYKCSPTLTDMDIPTGLFSALDGVQPTAVKEMFRGTFSYSFVKSFVSIKSGVLPNLDTSLVEDFTGMFYQTFFRGARGDVGRGYSAGNVPIPADLFSFLDMTSAKITKQMFLGTFVGYSLGYQTGTQHTCYIPDTLFASVNVDNCTDVSEMFSGTFSSMNLETTTFPDNIFSSIDTSNALTVAGIFDGAFSMAWKNTVPITIPATLFSGLKTSNSTTFSKVFSNTFNQVQLTAIPENLFAGIDTSSCTSFYNAFYGTFYQCGGGGIIPANLFSFLDTTNGVSFESMFERTFYGYSNQLTSIPATLFSSIRTPNGTNFNSMFNSTFYQSSYSASSFTLPGNMFANFDMSNATTTWRMFYYTFYRLAERATSATIPANMFAGIDAGTDNSSYMFSMTFSMFAQYSADGAIPADMFSSLTRTGTDSSYMFHSTFSSYAQRSTLAIPAALFSGIDTSSTTNFSYMFSGTFSGHNYSASVPMTIPASLFSFLDTTHGTQFSNMFASTFDYCYLSNIPAGLFASVDTSGISLANRFQNMFYGTFMMEGGIVLSSNPPLIEDVFAGMPSFNWYTGTSANNGPAYMFAATGSGRYSGSASTILQHFSTPSVDYNTFAKQDQLTDYATIDTNWK